MSKKASKYSKTDGDISTGYRSHLKGLSFVNFGTLSIIKNTMNKKNARAQSKNLKVKKVGERREKLFFRKKSPLDSCIMVTKESIIFLRKYTQNRVSPFLENTH